MSVEGSLLCNFGFVKDGFLSYRQKYVPPTDKEGFSEIVKVNFVPKFKNDKEKALYKTYLLDS